MTISHEFLIELHSKKFKEKLKEIYELLEEATNHLVINRSYDKYDEYEVTIIGQAWSFRYEEMYEQMHVRPGINIYSCLLGPYMNHNFKNIDDALKAVKYWYIQQMSN